MDQPSAHSARPKFVAELCAASPLLLSVLYIALAAHTRAWLGHWPRYSEYLDVFPSSTFKILAATFIIWGFFSLLGAPFVWWGTHRFRRFRPDDSQVRRQVAIFVVGWIIFFVLFVGDPNGFTSFLIDG